MTDLVKINAKIELFAGNQFRQTPFNSGYHPVFSFIGANTRISGRIDLIDMDAFSPGETAIVQISFIAGMLKDDHFKAGENFTFGEGRHSLGKGQIIERLQ